ncbi:MAG: hypothetical protein PHP52_13910 [Bacteroidales bacterium]|nr:hypothetical protein [Bacteroidales bacterium]MDD2387868.1 hypothetical protein [Bacteroidales bacterium]MDD4218398.1 hypothetical protein [Bacteroidales bacterium]MDY0140466.1 hypothetical protein [Bacteroidales bacterium]
MKNINTLLNISILILMTISLISCDDDMEPSIDSESIDCEWCFEERPEYVDLELIFNVEESDKRVIYTVYSGYAFASEIYFIDTTFENSIWISVLPDQKYTVAAEYIIGEQTIHVINDGFVKTKYFKHGCDNPCYYVFEASCDLKLKK